MGHLFTILIAVVFGSAVVSAGAGVLAYLRTRERADHAGTALVVTLWCVSLWAVVFGLQLAVGTTQMGVQFLHAKWIAGTPVLTTSLLFALYYTEMGDWVTSRWAALLAVEPALAASLVVLNPGGAFIEGVTEGVVFGVPVLVTEPGVGLWVHIGYGILIGIAFVTLLVRATVRSSGSFRTQAATLAVSAAVPLATELVFLSGPQGTPTFDTTPIAFGGVSLLFVFAMYRYDLFNVAPVAHETVFERLDDAIVVVDGSDRVLETNPAARETFDIDGDGVGRAAAAVLPNADGIEDLLDNTDAEIVIDDAGDETATGDGSSDSDSESDDGAGVDGTVGDADVGDGIVTEFSDDPDPRYFEATCEPLGREGVRLLVFRDVTERTRVERRYRAYVEHADDIVAVADADGVLEYVSPAVEDVLAYDAETLEGAVLTDYIHPDDRRGVAKPFAESLEDPGETVRVTFRARHRDGGWRILDGVGVNRFHDPHVGGYLLTLRDETQRDRYEQRLRVLTRVLRHDLRNELNVVLGYADVIVSDPDGNAVEHAESIRRSAERLASLGERVRGVDRTLRSTDHGGQPVDVSAIATDVAERARERFPEAEISTDCGEALAYADELLATAAWNVVENAVRHNEGESPRVALSTRRDDDTVELRIADDGPGIPFGDRTAVESGHETQLQHASGIGLWLVRWIVDGVDGELAFLDGTEATDTGEHPPELNEFGESMALGTVVVLRLRAAEVEPERASAGDQIDPWSVPAESTEVTDGGSGDGRRTRR